jgi:predicted DNA-binding transcriptional regulator YafY
VNTVYQSMSRPQPSPRIIEPHALTHDGFRWHARAFDRETGTFRDFVLGRLSKPGIGERIGVKTDEQADEDLVFFQRALRHVGAPRQPGTRPGVTGSTKSSKR